MANELTYQSVFTGQEMDERFTAVAQLQAALLEVETALSAKYVKPASGIPETDLDSAVQSALAKARSAVQDLSNYYTKTEIDSLLAAVNSQEYVDVATLPTASASTLGKIYLVGPTNNQYDRYYTSYDGSDYSWVAAGSTEINLSNYATKAELNQLDQEVSAIPSAMDQLREAGFFLNNPNLFDISQATAASNSSANVTWSVSDGVLTMSTTAGTNQHLYINLQNIISGKQYKIQLTVTNLSQTLSVRGGGTTYNLTKDGDIYSGTFVGASSLVLDFLFRNRTITMTNVVVTLADEKIADEYIPDVFVDSLIAERNEDAVTDSPISTAVDVSSYKDGTVFRVEVVLLAGTSDKYIYTNYSTQTGQKVTAAGSLYIAKTNALTRILFYAESGTGEVFNFKVYEAHKYSLNDNLFIPQNTLAIRNVRTLAMGDLFSGYYDSLTSIHSDNTWVSWPVQFSNGFAININADFSVYYVELKRWSPDFSTYRGAQISETTTVFIDNSVSAWHIQFRRQDRAAIDPADVAEAVTVTFASGEKWEKPAPLPFMMDQMDEVKKMARRYNPFAVAPYYAHYSPNDFIIDGEGNDAIASQSLADVEMAARLGFRFIEANIQVTSDGKFICIHGSDGKFGGEVKSTDESIITTAALKTTAINSVTLSWVKTYVRYNTTNTKNQTQIPSLEEFCECCRRNNIGIFAGTNQQAAIETCVQILGEDNVIVYGGSSNIRTFFHGYVFSWNNSASSTPGALKTAADEIGVPYMCGIGPTLAAQLISDDKLDSFLLSMHQAGYLVGHGYVDEETARDLFAAGMDFAAADYEVNPFKGDYIFDLNGSTSDFTTSGTIADGVATLASTETLSCGSSNPVTIGRCSLSIRFNGSLTIRFGSQGDRAITSDGTEQIVITDHLYKMVPELQISATASTTITELVYKYDAC